MRSHGGLSLSEVISELTILILLPLFALSHVHIGLPDTVIRDKAILELEISNGEVYRELKILIASTRRLSRSGTSKYSQRNL